LRICIFGAGAIGGHLAAKLGASGHEVSVIARGAHLEAMRSAGVVLHHGDDVIRAQVRAAERAAELGPQDVVLVTLKANLLAAFADAAAPLLGAHTPVVFIQNGIPWWYAQGRPSPKLPDLSRLDPGGKLARSIAPERVLGGVVYSANEVVAPGVIKNFVPGRNMLTVGEPSDVASSRIEEVREMLDSAGMPSPPVKEIRGSIWSKLVLNLGNSMLCVLTGESIAGVRGNPALSKISSALKNEGEAIARAHGVALEAAPQRPGGGHSSGMIGHKPSMLQDYERGRPMEIDAQLVATLEFARAAGVATPTLEALVPLCVHKAAAKGLYSH
jgi:2-dehydropantoate 2-reductase